MVQKLRWLYKGNDTVNQKKETKKDVKLINGTKRSFGVSLDIEGLKQAVHL